MFYQIFLITGLALALVSVPEFSAQTTLKGFEFLDNFSEDFEALGNVAKAETPFSHQLSICLWLNPTWARRGNTPIPDTGFSQPHY